MDFHVLDDDGNLLQYGSISGEIIQQPITGTIVEGPPPDHLIPPTPRARWDSEKLHWFESSSTVRRESKQKRTVDVSTSKILIGKKSFNADETSQARMLRRIFTMQQLKLETTEWVLADNTKVQVTLQELIDAFCAANEKQNEEWIKPLKDEIKWIAPLKSTSPPSTPKPDSEPPFQGLLPSAETKIVLPVVVYTETASGELQRMLPTDGNPSDSATSESEPLQA